MKPRAARLEAALHALQTQRSLLGDDVVELAAAPLQAELDRLRGAAGPKLAPVTVLFADIVGSTALSRELAPEDIHRVLDGALAAFTTIVERQGGQVLQYAGDGLLAVFGAVQAHEDDAVQAVRCGLALLDEARAQAARLARGGAAPAFNLRVGASSGQVLLGQGVDDAASIRGMPVNLAARMEQAAPPGALRVSHQTWLLLRGRFDADADEALIVKGCEEPVRSWLVRGERDAGPPGHPGPLCGRDREVAGLTEAMDRAAGGLGPDAVLWLGDVGVGKSRLLSEALHTAVRRGFHTWSATAHAPEAPYGLLRRLAGPAVVAGSPWLARLFGPRDVDDPVDAQAVRERGFAALLAQARALAAERPLLIVLDDLHEADEGSLDFLARLLGTPGPWPVLLVAAAQRAFDVRRPPPWPGGGAQRLPLEALGPAAARALADDLIAPLASPAWAALLAERAEGVPLHMQALAALWRERGLLAPDAEPDPAALDEESVPPTLPALLQARLDRLPASEVAALRAASIVGPLFWDAALPASARASLPALAERGMLQVQPAADRGAAKAWRFAHRALRDQAYAGVLAPDRRAAHRAAAEWLAGQPGEGVQASRAEHLERAGDRSGAAEAWARAGADAAARWANREAQAAYERALGAGADAPPALRLQRRRALHEVLLRLADAEAQRANLVALQALAPGADRMAQAEVALIEAEAENMAGRPAAALQALARLFDLAPEGAHRLRGRAHGAEAVAWRQLGRVDEALVSLAQGLPRARRAGDRRNEAALVNIAGMAAMDRDELDAAQAHFEQALALHRQSGHQGNEAATLSNLGYLDWALGDLDLATDRMRQAAALAAELGQSYNQGLARVNLSLVLGQRGAAEAAATEAEAALALLAASADPCALAAAQRAQGLALLALGQFAPAEAALVAARDALDALGHERLAMEPIAGLAEVALARGDAEGARRAAELILARAGPDWRVDGLDEPERVFLACAEALIDHDEARAAAARAAGRAMLQARADRLADPARRARLLSATPLRRRLAAEADLRTTG